MSINFDLWKMDGHPIALFGRPVMVYLTDRASFEELITQLNQQNKENPSHSKNNVSCNLQEGVLPRSDQDVQQDTLNGRKLGNNQVQYLLICCSTEDTHPLFLESDTEENNHISLAKDHQTFFENQDKND
jgi:hypothetical protein